jgi:hypothetical protein
MSSMGQAAPRGAASFVALARWALLLLAAGAFGLALALTHARDRAAIQSIERYVCPMHPEVVSSAPGDCPVCGMALERVNSAKQGPAPAQARDSSIETVQSRLVGGPLRAPAWGSADGVVTALLHRDDLAGLSPGDRAVFFAAAAPISGIDVRLLADAPVPVDASTCQARFRVDDPSRLPVLDASSTAVGLLQMVARPRELLTVPASAVLYSGEGPYVLVAAGEGDVFARRSVAIGRILDSSYAAGLSGDSVGAIVVLSGLSDGERVVTGNAFFLDAERRLRIARGQGQEAER